jgi:hypothetical protein
MFRSETITQRDNALANVRSLPKVNSDEDVLIINKWINSAKNIINLFKAERMEKSRPLDEAKSELINMEKDATSTLIVNIDILNSNVSNYLNERLRKQEEQERELESTLLNGQHTPAEELMIQSEHTKKMAEQSLPTGRVDWGFEITGDIPREYLMPDEKKIIQALKDGVQIPGIKPIKKIINVAKK